MKIGNRDLYGLDYRWINTDQMIERARPVDLVMVERREWGNFYGRLRTLVKEGQVVADGPDAVWRSLPALLRDAISNESERGYALFVVDANGKEKSIPLDQVMRVFRPNDLSVLEKIWVYVGNVWTVLATEPREANTEGGIAPAIFAVMMVIIMSVVVTPFGVIGALYLREYARQGIIVRTVRIAGNNLAGVPSIVFGVFGLGFFVYGVGGSIDALWFSDRLPNPTFGTGGILWASLTLALLTVPVVIVATEEGLAATPAHMSWQIDDALFVGDILFMPDYATARCDFPGGSAEQLFDSIQRIYALPDSTRLFMCHDYQPGGRELRFVTTVAEQKRTNIHLREGTSQQEFTAIRKKRDAQLDMPALILPAIQINIRAGEFPKPEANGTAYLKLPLNCF